MSYPLNAGLAATTTPDHLGPVAQMLHRPSAFQRRLQDGKGPGSAFLVRGGLVEVHPDDEGQFYN